MSAPNARPVVGHRPFREGGIRLATEELDGATFVHNYGHGGAGLTLSWGTAAEAIQLAKTKLNKEKTVYVIGGGVIGFTTAYLLAKEGYRVHMVSQAFFPDNVSNIAGGLWSPVSVDLATATAEEKDRINKIQIDSWAYFRSWEMQGWPVTSMPMFVTEEAQAKSGLDLFRALPSIFPITQHDRLPIEGVTQGGYEVRTILIDTPRYMAKLVEEVKQLGVVLETKKIDSMREAVKLMGASVIFNCTGLGAKEFAGDSKVVPVRGHLVYMKTTESFQPGKLGYMAFYGPEGTDYFFPREGEAVIGGTFEYGVGSTEVDPAVCAAKLNSINGFFGAAALPSDK